MAEKIVFHTPSGFMLRPFQEVLVRDTDDQSWRPDFLAEIEVQFGSAPLYRTITDDLYKQCIPYEGHEDFLGNARMPKYPKPKRELQFGDKVRAWDDDLSSQEQTYIFICKNEDAFYLYKVFDEKNNKIKMFKYCERVDS